MSEPFLSLARIEEAHAFVPAAYRDTPLLAAPLLDAALGVTVVAKDETATPIRSFKARGACVHVLRDAHGNGPLVAASAGNFGQGLAVACTAAGRRLIVYAAESASPVKCDAMRQLGAEVRLVGADVDAAKEAARAFALAEQLAFVEDGAEPAVAEGAGTIAVELARDAPPFDALVLPLGNGALLTGMAAWTKHVSPQTAVIGVVAAGAPAMKRSFEAGRLIAEDSVSTIADGIAIRRPVPFALETMRGRVDAVIAVNDAAIIASMRLAHRHLGRIVEPAGAAGLAGIAALAGELVGMRVATVLCGANLSNDQIARWIALDG